MFKPFFVHSNPFQPGTKRGAKSRGYTAYVQPHPTEEHLVQVSVARCNAKDGFNKRVGREEAINANNALVVNKRHLPRTLADMDAGLKAPAKDYNYLLRNFL